MRTHLARERANPTVFFTLNNFMQLLQKSECWPNGVIRHRSPDPKDIPILWYSNEMDEFLPTVKWSACNHNYVLSNLEAILNKTAYELGYHRSIWVYALYILSELSDERAVSIVESYIHKHVDYRSSRD